MQKILNGIINIIIVVHRDPFFWDSYCCKSATTMQKVHHVGMIVPGTWGCGEEVAYICFYFSLGNQEIKCVPHK